MTEHDADIKKLKEDIEAIKAELAKINETVNKIYDHNVSAKDYFMQEVNIVLDRQEMIEKRLEEMRAAKT